MEGESLLAAYARAEAAAFGCYLRKGAVPPELTAVLVEASAVVAFLKRNPHWPSQPRVPRGNPDGGRWTEVGGTGQPEAERPRPRSVDEIDDPPLEPVYPVEALVFGLSYLTMRGALAALRVVMGAARDYRYSRRVARAVKAIEDYLGGKPDRLIKNSAGDVIIMRGDKKIRFDINNYSPHNEPHFHIEKAVPITNGRGVDWVPADKRHHYYPIKKE